VTKKVVLAIAVILALGAFASADTLVGSTGSWQAGGWTANNTGNQFFSNTSTDGTLKNAGFCMTGTGTCTMVSGAPGALPFWGISPTVADPFVFFVPTTGESTTMQVEIAGLAGTNQFGYTDSLGSHLLFAGSATAGATVSFTAVGNYAFWIRDPGTGNQFSTYALVAPGLNTKDAGIAHFAIFTPAPPSSSSGDFWLAAEDLPWASSDHDFNDMIVHITALPIPEPGTLALFGSGLIGLASAMRRKLLA
jgi:hypothetical protein